MKNGFLIIAIACLAFKDALAANPFVMVMYDAKTEEHLGTFPPSSRANYGIVVSKLKEYGAKAIVIKFFLVDNKNPDGDSIFAASIKNIPTFLQARILNSEQTSNQIASSRFSINLSNTPHCLYSGINGWIPLEKFSQNSFDIGFVDIRQTEFIPMFAKYQNAIYKSLWFSILQYALPNLKTDGRYLSYGNKKLLLNKYGEIRVQYPLKDTTNFISFYDILNGNIDKSQITDKIALIGYDGDLIDSLTTPIGQITAHRIFCYSLVNIYDQLTLNH